MITAQRKYQEEIPASIRRRMLDQKILIHRLQRIMLLMMAVMVIVVIGAIAFVVHSGTKMSEYKAQVVDYETLKNEYENLYAEYESIHAEYMQNLQTLSEYQTIIAGMNEMIYSLDEQNKSLATSNQEYFDTIQLYEEREELFDKYEYSIIRTDGTRTDLTYDQLKTAEDLSIEQGLDTDMVLSIVMTESNGVEEAQSTRSTAKGYGQILDGTGEFVWEDLLNRGTYYPSYALNGYYNLEMTTAYLGYLGDYWDGDIYMMIKNYRGEDGDVLRNYIDKIDSYLSSSDKSIATLAQN